jgi:transposase, IS5 family
VREGIRAIVLRTACPERTLWGSILPQQCLSLPAGLAEIDALPDDLRFFEPLRPYLSVSRGRPSIQMEWFLRLMFLRFRYKLGFEVLCAEVTDSLAWRRFCRIPLGVDVPHPSTLEKIAKRCREGAVEALNEALLATHENRMIKLDKLRADSTVAAWLRRRNGEAKDEVLAITGVLADIADVAVAEARAVARNARRTLTRRADAFGGKAKAAVDDLERTAALVERIAAQTRLRLSGQTPDGASPVVSLHDSDARPIRKGRLGIPLEFGYKAQVVDNADGVVGHLVVKGNPPDAPMLVPAIERIKARFAKAP